MANNVIKRVWNQNRMVAIEDLKGMTFQAESGGHTFQISGVDDAGNVIALSGSVAGVFLRPDNTDVAITGSASGGVVSVTLPANCYDVPGRFGLTVFVTANGQKTAVYAAMGTVSRTSSGTVSPGTTSDVVDLINRINAAVATIPASWTGLMADIAPTYSDAAVYPVGAYCYYNGDLYRCTTAITTAESWAAGHWTQAVLGNDVSDLKSAIENSNNGFEKLNGNFIRGSLFNGAITSASYRVVNNEMMQYDRPIIISVKSGFRYLIAGYNSEGVYDKEVQATTGTTVWEANHKFRICILRVTEDTSENADIDYFVSQVVIDTVIDQKIKNLNGAIDYLHHDFTLHSIIRSDDGTMQTSPSFSYIASGYIPVGGLSAYNMSFMCTVIGTAGAAFYDINKEFISGFSASDVQIESTTPQLCETTIPEKAAYFRFTGYSSYSTSNDKYPVICKSNISVIKVASSIIEDAKKLVNDPAIDIQALAIINRLNNNTPKIVTLIDDDSVLSGIQIVKQMCDTLGIKCTFAARTENFDTDTVNALLAYQGEGYNIACHSDKHDMWYRVGDHQEPMFTLQEVEEDLLVSLNKLQENGFRDYNNLVYPGTSYTRDGIEEIVKKWCNCGVNSSGGTVNEYGKGLYDITRIFIQTNLHNTAAWYKIYIVDAALQMSSPWIVFGTHSYSEYFDLSMTTEVLQYCLSKGFVFMTLNEALKYRAQYYNVQEMYSLPIN